MSQVSTINRIDGIAAVARALSLPSACAMIDPASNALVAQSIRRSVFISAPCSYRTARALVTTALAPLADDSSTLEDRIAESIDDLVATGDLLEMRREGLDGGSILLRPAPPTFVVRKDGSFVILGVAGDDITPVEEQLVSYRPSGLRIVKSDDSGACRQTLLALGLIELPENIWLHAPAAATAESFLNGWKAKLPEAKKPEKITDLEVLESGASNAFYKGRWKPLSDKHAGLFLARRPQRYGANLWSLVDVAGGIVQRLVDIHAKDARFRACDEAWRILAAIDAMAGTPQKMDISSSSATGTIKFFSPLPAWAVRRLSMIGERVQPQHALLEFAVPLEDLKTEVLWLEQMLWLTHDMGDHA